MEDFERKLQNLALEPSIKPSCINSDGRDMAAVSEDKSTSTLSQASNHQLATDDLLPHTDRSPSSQSLKILLKKELFSKDNNDRDDYLDSGAVTPKTTLASASDGYSSTTTPLSSPIMQSENSDTEMFQSPEKTLTLPFDEIKEYFSIVRETAPLSSGEGDAISLAKERENSGLKMSPSSEKLIEPSEDEIEQFFFVMEKQIAERFAEKYNYDIINDEPLSGRYEWVPMVQNRKDNDQGEMIERCA